MQDFVIGYKLLQLGDGKDTASINDSNDLNKSVSSHLFEYINLKHVWLNTVFAWRHVKEVFNGVMNLPLRVKI